MRKASLKNPPASLGLVLGCDEAGRGSWAGPVVAAVVHLPPKIKIKDLDDSKKCTPAQRERIFAVVTKQSNYGVGESSNREVDEKGLSAATFLAFQRAIDNFKEKYPQHKIDHLWVDGRDPFPFEIPKTSIVKGDAKFRCIAAASIVAKVTRDRKMLDFAKKFPHYGFEDHKGYGTTQHLKALQQHKVCELHRISYAPIQCLLSQQTSFYSLGIMEQEI